jgi:hypothetical protein
MRSLGIDHLVTLIAAAPIKAPDWFEPHMPPAPPVLRLIEVPTSLNNSGWGLNHLRAYGTFNDDAPQDWKDFAAKHGANIKASWDWGVRKKIEKQRQWPLYWAKEQIKLLQVELQSDPEFQLTPYNSRIHVTLDPIPVKERTPRNGETVMAWVDGRSWLPCTYTSSTGRAFAHEFKYDMGEFDVRNVTHWLPNLPTPAK